MIVVLIVVWVALLVAVAHNTYRSRRSADRFDRVVASLRKPPRECESGAGGAGDNDAADREVRLSRQLLGGHLEPAAYRQAMTELAQSSPSTTGPVR